MAHEYIVHLTEQVKISHNRIKANGGVGPGGIPWGYKVIGEKYNKRMVPTEECKKYVPQMFERCIAGQSCRIIALWLDAEGVKPTRGEIWNDNSVWGMLQNMAYAGRRQDEGPPRTTGKKSPSRKNRRTIMTCEAVITMDTYRRAQEALHKRPPAGPYKEPPLLVGLKCARCASRGIDSPMYRMRKYYRCFGRGTRRKSCGNMIPMDQLDMVVIVRVFTTSTEPYQTKVWVPGKNWDAEIADTLQSLHELDPIDDEDYDERHAELIAKLREYKRKNREESTAGHYEKKDVRKPDGSIMTEGEHFRDLDEDGQREYLKTHDIQAEKVIIPAGYPTLRSTVGTPGIHVVIDGKDYGITPFARPGSFDRMRATA